VPDDFIPDPRLVEEARNARAREGLLNAASMDGRNAAVVKVKVDGEIEYFPAMNVPSGAHSEELLATQIRNLRLQGQDVEVLELFTERLPCTQSGGCRPMMSAYLRGAKVSFWTKGGTGVGNRLRQIYGF